MSSRYPISRRTILRGIGTAMALPMLDAMMPNGDGYDVCRSLRADPDLDQPHVIMLTASAREVYRERAAEVGVDEFMTKPFSPRELRERVQELLESPE